MTVRKMRCAIYTRKSTEEGLDQAFNSLEAQREACKAYIQSQAGEGWASLKEQYDDGGFSGGTMDRPALKKLLADIEARRIDVVVVYKVDRLTRSLSDFARIVEILDVRGVSFVSVTQQFNTTTSMGRLTLNVLLSFAQFEREVTAERIRDKIAASKKKGMWMGGVVPLGYDLAGRKLVPNKRETETARILFRLYRKLGNTRLVKDEADRLGLRSKPRRSKDGARQGGSPFTRGHINKLLANPLYIGEISHKGARHKGEHRAIVDRETWDAVQEKLERNAVVPRGSSISKSPSLLAGLIVDSDGNRMVPSHANKAGRRYRYYVTKRVDRGGGTVRRLPAPVVEKAVIDGLCGFLTDKRRLSECGQLNGGSSSRLRTIITGASRLNEQLTEPGSPAQRSLLMKLITRVAVGHDLLRITVKADALRSMIGADDHSAACNGATDTGDLIVDVPIAIKRRGVETRLIITDDRSTPARPDPNLIATVGRAHVLFGELGNGTARSIRDLAKRHGIAPADISRVLPLALLAPDIVEAIVDGRQPVELTAVHLKRRVDLPASWADQRRRLGFA